MRVGGGRLQVQAEVLVLALVPVPVLVPVVGRECVCVSECV